MPATTTAKPGAAQSAFQIGTKLVKLCKQGKHREAIEALYAPNVISIEAHSPPGMPTRTEGFEAVMTKSKNFAASTTIHSSTVEGPWPHGDRFIVKFSLDATFKQGPMAGQRMQMTEGALYTVKDGKITQEEFFYPSKAECGG